MHIRASTLHGNSPGLSSINSIAKPLNGFSAMGHENGEISEVIDTPVGLIYQIIT
jgi:hypothetical protein